MLLFLPTVSLFAQFALIIHDCWLSWLGEVGELSEQFGLVSDEHLSHFRWTWPKLGAPVSGVTRGRLGWMSCLSHDGRQRNSQIKVTKKSFFFNSSKRYCKYFSCIREAWIKTWGAISFAVTPLLPVEFDATRPFNPIATLPIRQFVRRCSRFHAPPSVNRRNHGMAARPFKKTRFDRILSPVSSPFPVDIPFFHAYYSGKIRVSENEVAQFYLAAIS
jgi:hypothetical protein